MTRGELERALAQALRAMDPIRALEKLRTDEGLSPQLRAWVAAIDPEGFRLTALTIARLRFERLVHGSGFASTWAEADTAGFARAFRRYHAEVPPHAHFPVAEAQAFEAWAAECQVMIPGSVPRQRCRTLREPGGHRGG